MRFFPKSQALCGKFTSTLSGASRQLSQRESLWQAGQLWAGRRKPDITQKIVPCYRGQQLRNHVPCQAAASLGSRVLLFAIQIKLYSSSMGLTDTPVPLPLGATATTAASGGNREELLGPRPARMRAAAKQTLGAATRTHLRGESPPACGGYFTLSRNRTKPARPASSSL